MNTLSRAMQSSVVVILLSLTHDASGQSLFLPGALSAVEISHRDRKGIDISEVEVHVTPMEVVGVEAHAFQAAGSSEALWPLRGEQAEEVLALEVREEGGCWRRVDQSPTKRGKRLRWRVRVAPCLSQTFRLAFSPGSCVKHLHHTKVIPAQPLYLVEQARHFLPAAPKNLRLATNSSLRWEEVPCASGYSLTYSAEGGEEREVTVQDGATSHELDLSDGECGSLEAEVKALSGKRMGPGTKATFDTCLEEEEGSGVARGGRMVTEGDATLEVASFLLAEEEEETCPATSALPICSLLEEPKLTKTHPVLLPTTSLLPAWVIAVVGVASLVLLAIIITLVIRNRRHSWDVQGEKDDKPQVLVVPSGP